MQHQNVNRFIPLISKILGSAAPACVALAAGSPERLSPELLMTGSLIGATLGYVGDLVKDDQEAIRRQIAKEEAWYTDVDLKCLVMDSVASITRKLAAETQIDTRTKLYAMANKLQSDWMNVLNSEPFIISESNFDVVTASLSGQKATIGSTEEWIQLLGMFNSELAIEIVRVIAECCKQSVLEEIKLQIFLPEHDLARQKLMLLVVGKNFEYVRRMTEAFQSLYEIHEPAIEIKPVRKFSRDDFLFSQRWTPLLGRESETKLVEDFLTAPGRLLWHRITGLAGSGKSRFAHELCINLQGTGWIAGFLLSEFRQLARWKIWKPIQKTLIIIDYALDDPTEIGLILNHLSNYLETWSFDVRFLLLDREESDLRWGQIIEDIAGNAAKDILFSRSHSEAFPNNLPSRDCNSTYIRLGALSDNDYLRIAASHWQRRDADSISNPKRESTFLNIVEGLKKEGHAIPLFVLFAAENVINPRNNSDSSWSRDQLARYILRKEVKRWRESLAVGNIMYLAALLGKVTFPLIDEKLSKYCGNPTDSEIAAACSLAGGFYGDKVESIQPDALAELYILERLLGSDAAFSFNKQVAAKDNAERMLRYCLEDPASKNTVLNTLIRTYNTFPDLASKSQIPSFLNRPEELRFFASILPKQSRNVIRSILLQGHVLFTNTDDKVSKSLWTGALAEAVRDCRVGQDVAEFVADKYSRQLVADISYFTGFGLYAAGNIEESLPYLLHSGTIIGSTPRYLGDLLAAQAFSQLGNHEEAIRCYESVSMMPHAPADQRAVARFNRAGELGIAGCLEESLTAFQAILSRNDVPSMERFKCHMNCADALYKLNQLSNAISHYEAALTYCDGEPDYRSNALLGMGTAFLKDENLEEAGLCYLSILSMNDTSEDHIAQAHVNYGVVLALAKSHEHAIESYDLALSRKGISAELRAQALSNKGCSLQELGSTELAITYYEEALKIEAIQVDAKINALLNRGVLLGKKHLPVQALEVYDSLLKIVEYGSARHAEVEVNRGFELSEIGKMTEALEAYDLAIMSPITNIEDRLRALVNKGFILLNLNQYDESLVCSSMAIAEGFSSKTGAFQELLAQALINQGLSYGRLGQTEKAIGSWRRIFSIEDTPKSKAFAAIFNIAEELRLTARFAEAFAENAFLLALPNLNAEELARALLQKSNLLHESGEDDSAIPVLQNIIESVDVPDDLRATALNKIAAIFGSKGQPEDVINVCRAALKLPDIPADTRALTLYFFGLAFDEKGDAADSAKALEQCLEIFQGSNEHRALIHLALGSVLEKLSRFEESRASYQYVVTSQEASTESRIRALRSKANLDKQLEGRDRAILTLNELLSIGGLSVDQKVDCLAVKASWLRENGQAEEAIVVFERILSQPQLSADVRINALNAMSACLLELGKFEKCSALNEQVKVDPFASADQRAQATLLDAFARPTEKDEEESIASIQLVLADPNISLAMRTASLLNLGVMKLAQEDLVSARSILDGMIALPDESLESRAQVLLLGSLIMAAEGKKDEALAQLDRMVLSLDRASPLAVTAWKFKQLIQEADPNDC